MAALPLAPTVSRQSVPIALAELPVTSSQAINDAMSDTKGEEDGEEKSVDAEAPSKQEFKMTDQTLLLPTKRLLIVLAASSSCILLSFLDQTIVATALPTIGSYFGSGKNSSWVATAYLVASTASQPLYGRLSDIFGRKVVLLGAVGMFTVFSLACALARTMLQLILFRAFQGVFGGGLLTMVMIVMADLISLKDRGKFQGVVEGMIAVANGLGPTLGAVFAEKASWRWCFWINLPLCAISAILLVIFLPSKPTNGDMRAKLMAIDYIGSLGSLAATVLLLMALTWGGVTYAWTSPQVLVPLILSIVLIVAFLAWEGKVARHPVIPLSVFKNATSAGVLSATFLLGSAYYILLFYIPAYLQVVLGYSAITSSVLLLPFVLVVTIIVESAGLIISKFGRYREFVIAGFGIWAAGAGALTTLRTTSSKGEIIGFLLLCGLGAGLTVQTTVIALMASCADRKDVAVALSCRNYLRLLGGSIFLAVATTIINNGFRNRLTGTVDTNTLQAILNDPTYIQHTLKNTLDAPTLDTILQAYISAFRTLFFVVMGLLLVAMVVSVLFIKHHSLKREEDKQLKEEGKRYLEEEKAKKAGRKDQPEQQV